MSPEEALLDLLVKLILHDFAAEVAQGKQGQPRLTLTLDGSQLSTYVGGNAELELLLAHLKTFRRWQHTLRLRGEVVAAETNIDSYRQGIIALTLALECGISMEEQVVGQFTTRPLIDFARCARRIMVDNLTFPQAVRQQPPVGSAP
jgi:hypothetical protein